MDPMTTLATIRSLVTKIKDPYFNAAKDPQAPLDLANAVNDLDEWLSQGGFLPGQWAPVIATIREQDAEEAAEAQHQAELDRSFNRRGY